MKYKHITYRVAAVSAGMGLMLSGASAALAFSPSDYALFGGATYASPGEASNRAVKLVSDDSTTHSGIDYGLGTTTTTFADIESLATSYKFDAGTCGGGSPRFQVNVASTSGDTGNIFVYIGPAPSYTGCPVGVWTSSGELIGTTPVDTSQLDGGTFYDPYATALAKYGEYEVTGIQLVADGGWAMPLTGQVVNVDNTMINDTVYTYEVPTPTSKEACMKGGWRTMGDANGTMFKNQGDCVSYAATGGENTAATSTTP